MAKENAKPLRTVLFCAGSEEDDIREGFASRADSIVIDLEEPRTPFSEAQRDAARALVKSFLASLPPTGPTVFVRVQNPRELAALLLEQPVAVINQGIALGYTNRRMLPAPIPVFMVYQTAFLGANGTIEFRPDVYQRDDEIWQHLHPAGQAPVAQDSPMSQRRS